MSTKELKQLIYNMIDSITDKNILVKIYTFIKYVK